jgi:hypothetical protein
MHPAISDIERDISASRAVAYFNRGRVQRTGQLHFQLMRFLLDLRDQLNRHAFALKETDGVHAI